MPAFKKKPWSKKVLLGAVIVAVFAIFMGSSVYHGDNTVSVSGAWVMSTRLMGNSSVCYDLPPLVLAMCDVQNKTVYQPRSQTMCTTLNDGVYTGVQNVTILRYNSTDTWGGTIKTVVRYSNNSLGDYVIKPWFAVDNSKVRCGDYLDKTSCAGNSCQVNVSTGGF